jgi:hypothetical protein
MHIPNNFTGTSAVLGMLNDAESAAAGSGPVHPGASGVRSTLRHCANSRRGFGQSIEPTAAAARAVPLCASSPLDLVAPRGYLLQSWSAVPRLHALSAACPRWSSTEDALVSIRSLARPAGTTELNESPDSGGEAPVDIAFLEDLELDEVFECAPEGKQARADAAEFYAAFDELRETNGQFNVLVDRWLNEQCELDPWYLTFDVPRTMHGDAGEAWRINWPACSIDFFAGRTYYMSRTGCRETSSERLVTGVFVELVDDVFIDALPSETVQYHLLHHTIVTDMILSSGKASRAVDATLASQPEWLLDETLLRHRRRPEE